MGHRTVCSHALDVVLPPQPLPTLDDQRVAIVAMMDDLTPEEIGALYRLIRWWRSMDRSWRTRRPRR